MKVHKLKNLLPKGDNRLSDELISSEGEIFTFEKSVNNHKLA